MTVERRYKLLHAQTLVGDIDLTMSPTWTGLHTYSPVSGPGIVVNQPAGTTDGIEVFGPAGNAAQITLAGNGVAASLGVGVQYSPGGNLNLNLGGSIRMRLAAAGASIFGWGPNAAGLVDMTPDSGTYVGTLTGITGTPTATIQWIRMGNVAMVFVPSTVLAIGTSTALTITGALPASMQPAKSQTIAVPAFALTDNGAKINTASISVGAGSSTIVFLNNDSSAGFTAAGNKGVSRQFSFSYLLN